VQSTDSSSVDGAEPDKAELDAAAEDAAEAGRLGAHVRALRRLRGLTLVQLAQAAELSHPFLSQLERGHAQPSLASLRRIARALDSSPIELIAAAQAAPPASERIEIHRTGELVMDAGFSASPARLLASVSRPMHPLEVTGRDSTAGEVYRHREDEFVYVLSGTVAVELDGEEHSLDAGDSVYFGGGTAHRWWSRGGDYRLLVVKQGTPEVAAEFDTGAVED
jgi:transcriptional regulator with XRE-family HTH domain